MDQDAQLETDGIITEGQNSRFNMGISEKGKLDGIVRRKDTDALTLTRCL